MLRERCGSRHVLRVFATCYFCYVTLWRRRTILLYHLTISPFFRQVGLLPFPHGDLFSHDFTLIPPLNWIGILSVQNNRCTFILAVTICTKPIFLRIVKSIHPPMRLAMPISPHQQPILRMKCPTHHSQNAPWTGISGVPKARFIQPALGPLNPF